MKRLMTMLKMKRNTISFEITSCLYLNESISQLLISY